MSILLKTDIRGIGTAGQTVDIDAAQEADLVHRGAATYVQQKGLDVDPVVRAKVDLLTGRVTNSVAGNSGLPLSLRTGRTIAVLGDSQARNNNWDGTAFTSKFNSQLGFLTWAMQFTKHRFITSPALNFGVFGDTTAQVLARVPQVIAAAPDICVISGIGTNDASAGATPDTIVANILQIWTALTNAGIVVVHGTIFPRSYNMTSQISSTIQRVNQQLRVLSKQYPGVSLYDPYPILMDPASTSSGCLTALFADNLHLNRTGAFWAGKSLAAVLDSVFPAVAIPAYQCVSASDTYDATYNPAGNKLVNSALAGTSGTKAGAYATGNVADSWTVYRASGSTISCVASKGTKTLDNGQTIATQILTVSSAGSGAASEEITLFQNFTAAQDDVLIAGCEIDVASISGRLNYVTPQLQAQYGSYSVLARDAYYAAGGAQGIPASYSAHGCTNTGVVPSGGTSVQMAINIGLDCTVASSVQVTIALPYSRKVA